MGYGKVNTEGYLMSSSKQIDDTWLELSSFEVDSEGNYYAHYNQDGTADTAKIDEAKVIADREAFKAQRAINVAKITVEVECKVFDGDVNSQNTMVRAIQVLHTDEEMPWVLADNSVIMVNQTVLGEALRLSGEAQSALWVQE